MKITRRQAHEKLTSIKNGTIYSVTFIKKDGTVRVMNSIKGTRRGVKGVGLKFDPAAKNLIPVYDVQLAKQDPSNPEKCWRMVNLETVTDLCIDKQEYSVID